jgi:hypothetical protein
MIKGKQEKLKEGKGRTERKGRNARKIKEVNLKDGK